MSLSSNRILGGGGGGGGGGCKEDIQTAVIKTKNVGENRKNRKKRFLALSFSPFPFLRWSDFELIGHLFHSNGRKFRWVRFQING